MLKLCKKGRLIMFCSNCGNKLNENAYVCVNCGIILKKRSDNVVVKEKKETNVIGILSIVFGSLSLVLSLLLFFHDISSVGMYTEIYERVFFALENAIFAILFASVSLILSLVGKRTNYSNIGLALSILSFFFIITEVFVVIIY